MDYDWINIMDYDWMNIMDYYWINNGLLLDNNNKTMDK